MWFWLEHGWIITAGICGFYSMLAVILAWLIARILRTRSAFSFIVLCSAAVPIAAALVNFFNGTNP